MRFLTIAIVFIISLLTFSCNNFGKNNNSNEHACIELNNGQKWTVNAEMSPFILDSETILNEYDGNDYAHLAAQLKDKNGKLIKSCTMNGKSHDELHKWLHPHLQLVDALSKADIQQKADEIINQLIY